VITSCAIYQNIRRKSTWREFSILIGNVTGKIIFADEYERIFRKWDVGIWTESSWLRIGTGGGHV
jgi:hypothetical protein